MTRSFEGRRGSGGSGEQVDASTAAGSRGGTDHPSDAPDPWNHYWRQAARPGWTSPLGREQVRAALAAAGTLVDSLIIGRHRTALEDDPPGLPIIEVRHTSDARGGYGRVRPSFTMLVYAVPSDRRHEIRRELVEVWLPAACAWAASTTTRGNAWSASDHGWTLWMQGAHLKVTER